MQRGADIARLSADMTLIDDDISWVTEVRRMTRLAMEWVENNSQATAMVNTAILGSAAPGCLPPVQAALLHNGNTILILLSALATSSNEESKQRHPIRGPVPHRSEPFDKRLANHLTRLSRHED